MNLKTQVFAASLCVALNAFAETGSFFQYDRSSASDSLVAVHSVDDLQFSGAYSDWNNTGKSYALSATQRIHATEWEDSSLQFRLGVTALRHEEGTSIGAATALGIKLGAENFSHGRWGSVYALTEISSTFRTWLGVVQYTPPGSRLGLEWSAVGDDRWFVGHRVALRYGVEGTPWSLRAGRQLEDGKLFIGLSYSTF